MKKLLTVSVAAYNVAEYLDKLMHSLIDSQMMEQLEILIVDDGSKDNTAEKALYYQKKYLESVRLISKENGGHGSTINRGIREATGKYFRVLDGDDWVHPGHLKALMEKMEDIDADLILSEYCECYEDGTTRVVSDYTLLEDGRYYDFDELQKRVEWMRLHTAIFRTELLQEHCITLDEHCFYVDTEFMMFPIPYVEKVYFSKNYIYCYRLGLPGQSVSKNGRMKHISDGETVTKSLLAYYARFKPLLMESKRNYFICGIAHHCLFHYKSLMLFPASRKNKQQLLAYERLVKNADQEVYAKMADFGQRSRMLKTLRGSHYLLYRMMHWYKTKIAPIE